jgi:hypothetical protein
METYSITADIFWWPNIVYIAPHKILSYYSTTISLLLGSPSPDLFIAITRYSISLPFGGSTKSVLGQRCVTPAFVSIILTIVVKSKANRSGQKQFSCFEFSFFGHLNLFRTCPAERKRSRILDLVLRI